MILVIDNVDSFVHNLARYVRLCGFETVIVRNNETSVADCLAHSPSGVVISPGPGRPSDAGVSMDLIRALPAQTPLLGVCLGHQCLVEVFGGRTARARRPLHGEASMIAHDGAGLFEGAPSPTPAGRYHSLIASLADDAPLIETAWSEEGEVMAARHRERPWFGVQFHPESLLTPYGRLMVDNFLRLCAKRRAS